MKFTEKAKLSQGNDLIMTYYGQVLEYYFFAYIKCKQDGVRLMREDHKNKEPRDIKEYGEVIYRDNINSPNDKAVEFLTKYLANNSGELI